MVKKTRFINYNLPVSEHTDRRDAPFALSYHTYYQYRTYKEFVNDLVQFPFILLRSSPPILGPNALNLISILASHPTFPYFQQLSLFFTPRTNSAHLFFQFP